ncbi:hypothetical protein AMJ80_04170 [bacterium SM23_31]|nr:MAG: hypothetical protein AMJ80_04170 [bacterium SM23_31]
MRAKLLIFSMFFIISSCGSEEAFLDPIYENALENVLTLELSFGDEGLPDEFLIARDAGHLFWVMATADDSGNFYLFDEKMIKVYDKDGKAKTTIGRPGEGPGEFSSGRFEALPTVSPTGYVTVLNDHGMYKDYNMYDPQYKFLKTVNRIPKIFGTQYRCEVFSLSESEYIRENYDNKESGNLQITTFSIEHIKNNEKKVIVSYDVTTDIIQGRSRESIPHGKLFWEALPGRKIAFTFSWKDEIYSDEGNFYIIHVNDLDSGEHQEIKRQFEPVPLPEYMDEHLEINNIKNMEAITHAFFDGKIMYAFTSIKKKIDENRYESLVDVIDLENCKYLRSVYLPEWGDILAIKGGYAYLNGVTYKYKGQSIWDKFSVIEKYKIDPAVYGK